MPAVRRAVKTTVCYVLQEYKKGVLNVSRNHKYEILYDSIKQQIVLDNIFICDLFAKDDRRS